MKKKQSKEIIKRNDIGQVQGKTVDLFSQRFKQENKKCSTVDEAPGSYGDNSLIQMDHTGDLMPNSILNSWCQQLHDVDMSDEIEFDAENADDGKISHEKFPQLPDVSFSHEQSYTSRLTSMTAIPSHIHLHKTKNKTSSQRTQLGSIAHVVETKNMSNRRRRDHNCKFNKKRRRINKRFINVEIQTEIMKLAETEFQENYIVIDGGDNTNPAIKRPKNLNKKWKRIRVLDGIHLHAVMSNSHDKGLMHCAANGSFNFMLLSREETMNILPKHGLSGLSAAISACEKAKGSALI